jgi:hypothetical protein
VVVVWACVLAYGWWATTREPFSAGATVAVVGAGVVAIAVGFRRPGEPVVRERRGIAVWAVLALSLFAWQMAAYFQHPRSDHPTLSSITNALLEPDVARAAAFVGWLVVARWAAAVR